MSATAALSTRLSAAARMQTLPAKIAQSAVQSLGRTTYREIPLNHAYPLPEKISEAEYQPVKTTVSTLSNGLRVVSRNTQEPIVNVGLFVSAGSRFCKREFSGIGHFLESVATEGTNNINANRFAENLARTGSTYSVQAFRDSMLYQVETFRDNADFALETIAESIWNPNVRPYELPRLRQEYLWRRGDSMRVADLEMPELMQQAAWQGNTLGLPFYCDDQTVKHVDADLVKDFTDIFYIPKRMVVAGVGLEHQELERLAQQTLGDRPDKEDIETAPAVYTGGQLKLQYEFDDPGALHAALLFESEHWTSPDMMALNVLTMMMGGGGSFSAGGPGKGMYTRLYRDVLGEAQWLDHISATHYIYDDSGAFALYASAAHEQLEERRDLWAVLVASATNMVLQPPKPDELARAKAQLACNICYEFENRTTVFEDIARQVAVYGNHRTPEAWRDQIMSVSAQDVVKVAQKLLKSKPTMLAVGRSLGQVPPIEQVEEVIKRTVG